jgi:hypothetical protein
MRTHLSSQSCAENPPLTLLPFARGCQQLHAHPRTVKRLLKKPDCELPRPVRIGGRDFFFEEQIARYLSDKAAEVGFEIDAAPEKILRTHVEAPAP